MGFPLQCFDCDNMLCNLLVYGPIVKGIEVKAECLPSQTKDGKEFLDIKPCQRRVQSDERGGKESLRGDDPQMKHCEIICDIY